MKILDWLLMWWVGIRLRFWVFITFISLWRDCISSLSDLRVVAKDYLWQGLIRGHIPGGFLQHIFEEMCEYPDNDLEKLAHASDGDLVTEGVDAIRRIFVQDVVDGSSTRLTDQLGSHLSFCPRCQADLREIVWNVYSIRLITQENPAEIPEDVDRRVVKRVTEEVMRQIRDMPDESGPRLRLIKGGRYGRD
ncbi:MAG: hypothetical protein U9Q03_00145 [Patescibacteria group bacterium]|nr:hypothetical protein [Patescibacteria group bacterium]